MWQNIVVFIIVAGAALYALWRWLPSSWRAHLARRVAAGSERAGWLDTQRARALANSLARTPGCGSCDACGGAACAGAAPAASPAPAPPQRQAARPAGTAAEAGPYRAAEPPR